MKNRILVFHDDQINILLISSFLRSLNFQNFYTAFNGSLAFEKILSMAKIRIFYNLVIMDCMPVIDGFEAIKNLRKLIAEGGIPYLSMMIENASLLE